MASIENPLLKENKETVTVEERSLILINDDYNTFEHVIRCLIKYCKHDELQAEQCAHIVHYSGKCSVKQGDFDKLLPIATALMDMGLTVEVD